MKIGFAANTELGSDARSIFEHASDLGGPLSEDFLVFRYGPETETACDIVVADHGKSIKKCKLKTLKHTVCTTEKRGCWFDSGFDYYLARSNGDRKLLLTQGLREDKIKVVGVPRFDVLFSTVENQEAIRLLYCRAAGLDPHKITVLIALDRETCIFRDDIMLDVINTIKKANMNLLIYVNEEEPLPRSLKPVEELRKNGVEVRSLSTDQDQVPILLATDIMITAGPWLATNFIGLKRPIITFWQNGRAWWEKIWSPTTTNKLHELEDCLKNPSKVKLPDDSLVERIFGYTDGKSTERALNFIMEKCSCESLA